MTSSWTFVKSILRRVSLKKAMECCVNLAVVSPSRACGSVTGDNMMPSAPNYSGDWISVFMYIGLPFHDYPIQLFIAYMFILDEVTAAV